MDQNDLECGAHWPSHEVSTRQLSRQQACPDPIHNNCSGKHLGFLTLAHQLGVPHKGYVEVNHPVQQKVRSILEILFDLDLNLLDRILGSPAFASSSFSDSDDDDDEEDADDEFDELLSPSLFPTSFLIQA